MSSTPSPSNPNNTSYLSALGAMALVIACGGIWFFDNLPAQKEYLPADRLKLTTESVPLSRQVLVLVDDYPGSTYFDSILSGLSALANGLTEEQEICLFQVGSDHPVMHQEPWCSDQIKKAAWVLPEIKPAPYANQAEEQAYTQARAKLMAELDANFMRAQGDWTVRRSDRLLLVQTLLWQLPEQGYHSLVDSLVRLLKVRRVIRKQPTEVIIYSPMVDALYAPNESTLQVDLTGVDVQIRVMTSEGDVGLVRARNEWNPWLNAGHPAKLEWSILEPIEEEATPQSKAVHPAPVPMWGNLPPVVPKPPVEDRTSVVRGEPVAGDATNVTREE